MVFRDPIRLHRTSSDLHPFCPAREPGTMPFDRKELNLESGRILNLATVAALPSSLTGTCIEPY